MLALDWRRGGRFRWLALAGAAGLVLGGAAVRPAAQPPELQPRELCVLRGQATDLLVAAALSGDGKRAASCGPLQGANLWDVDRGKALRRLTGHAGGVTCVAFAPDGKRVLTGGEDKTVRVWSVATGKELLRLRGHIGRIQCAVFAPKGGSALSATVSRPNPTIRLWNLNTGREARRYTGHALGVAALAFAPDGKRFASAGWDGTVRLWGVSTGKALRVFEGHAGMVRGVAFSPDGRQLLSAGADKTLRLWDAQTGAEIRKLDEPAGSVNSVAFLPGGRYAVAGAGGEFSVTPVAGGTSVKTRLGKQQAVRLWDLQAGKQVHTFAGPTFAVVAVAVSADGRRVLAASGDGSLRAWELPDLKEPPKEQANPK
jgi:WD40 repeat protein